MTGSEHTTEPLLWCRSSKLSQVVVLRELREGAGRSLAECLPMEFRMVHQCVTGKSDFVEGVRALLIDKTGKPQWDPSSIEQVGQSMALNCLVCNSGTCL